MNTKTGRGFTLIELLVVIAIIGILAAMVIVAMSATKKKARDAQRKSDLAQIVKVVEIYNIDNEKFPLVTLSNQSYTTGALCSSNQPPSSESCDLLSTILINGGHIAHPLTDPLKPTGGGWGNQYQYGSTSDGKRYYIRTRLESRSDTKTHNYPDGTTCVTSGLPTASWYDTAVYEGYNTQTCGMTWVRGSG